MKNFKKLFSIAAIVAMVGTAVPTTVLGAASYSDELQGAYDYAYGIGITTQSSIDTANMYGSLLRSHMAKMMVNYATEVMGQTPDTSKTCEFTDVANQTEELQGYITEACQLGLMGVGITAFNPNGVVTRAQFGTVLDRVLNGDANDGSDPYYADHLSALKDAGIMTNISNPNAPEVRGYVMLMMQRADTGTTPAVCETPENVLSCSLGLDTCPAECVVTEPTSNGTLNISISSDTPAGGTIPSNANGVTFLTFKAKATSEDVKINQIVVKRTGIGSPSDFDNVYLYKGATRLTSGKSVSSSANTVTFSSLNLTVKAGETMDLSVVADFATPTANNQHRFSIEEVSSIDANTSNIG
jgi:hypothetical protein